MNTRIDQARPVRGRPSRHSADIADRICERLADGESLQAICSQTDMPNRATVFRWLGQFEDFRDQYARAREAQADALADEILDIADDTGDAQTAEGVARARLRVDARKWIAAKLKPRVYGERIQQEIAADVRVETANEDEARALALAERLERLANQRGPQGGRREP